MVTIAIILGLLVFPLLISRLVGRLRRTPPLSPRTAGCLGIALVFCFTGLGHFVKTEPMAEMLPPWVPARVPIVYVTGVIEFIAAAAVLVPRLRRVTGIALIVMLIGFLPANIYAAIERVGMGGHEWGPLYLLIRVPLQAILIGWIWWFAVRQEESLSKPRPTEPQP